MWCCRTLLRVPWTARRPTILKDISLEYSLETLMLKWKLQYSGHLMQRTDSLEKTLILKKIEGRRRRGRQRVRWMDSITTQWTWVWASSGSWWWTGRPDELQSMGLQRVGHDWVAELNWTEEKEVCWRIFITVFKNKTVSISECVVSFCHSGCSLLPRARVITL